MVSARGAVGSTMELDLHEKDIERASRSLKAIAHPLRLKILCTLGEDEITVQDIVERVGTSQSNISQHLAILRDKEILASRKLRFCCTWPWQRAVARRVLHGPLTSACPASLLRTHPDAEIAVADCVAELPDIQSR